MAYDPIEPVGYIIQDSDGIAIHGIGKTEQAAWNEVSANCDPIENYDGTRLDPESAEYQSHFRLFPASAKLIALVESGGGACAWGRVLGVACTRAEESAYDATLEAAITLEGNALLEAGFRIEYFADSVSGWTRPVGDTGWTLVITDSDGLDHIAYGDDNYLIGAQHSDGRSTFSAITPVTAGGAISAANAMQAILESGNLDSLVIEPLA